MERTFFRRSIFPEEEGCQYRTKEAFSERSGRDESLPKIERSTFGTLSLLREKER